MQQDIVLSAHTNVRKNAIDLAEMADLELNGHSAESYFALLSEIYQDQPGLLASAEIKIVLRALFHILYGADQDVSVPAKFAEQVLQRLRESNANVGEFETNAGFVPGFFQALTSDKEIGILPIDFLVVCIHLEVTPAELFAGVAPGSVSDPEIVTLESIGPELVVPETNIQEKRKESAMNAHNEIDAAAAAEVFGTNVARCVELLGRSLDSLALRADVDVEILRLYAKGEGVLTDSRVDAVAHELKVDPSLLTTDHGDEDETDLALVASLGDQLSGTDFSEDAEPIQESEETEESEVIQEVEEIMEVLDSEISWDESGLVATVGDQSISLKDKSLRAALMQRIDHLRGDMSYQFLSTESGIDKASSWWSGVRNGNSLAYRADVERLAEFLGTSCFVLLTGAGLSLPPPISSELTKSTSSASGGKIILPKQNARDVQAYFRSQVLSRTVVLAEGVEPGEIFELMQNESGVDWQQVWLLKTKKGESFRNNVAAMSKNLTPMGDQVKALFFTELAKTVWPDTAD